MQKEWLPLSEQHIVQSKPAPRGNFYWQLLRTFSEEQWHTWPAGQAWWEAREGILERLGLHRPARGGNKVSHNFIEGYTFANCGKPRNLQRIDEDHFMQSGERVIVKVLPKHSLSPPKVRKLKRAAPQLPTHLTEAERLQHLVEHSYAMEPHLEIPEERIGNPPHPRYICRNCGRRGHYLRNCPWKGGGAEMTREERQAQRQPLAPTGIPRAHLRELPADQAHRPDVYVDPQSGRVFAADFANPQNSVFK